MLHPAVLKSRQQKKRLVGFCTFQHVFLFFLFYFFSSHVNWIYCCCFFNGEVNKVLFSTISEVSSFDAFQTDSIESHFKGKLT